MKNLLTFALLLSGLALTTVSCSSDDDPEPGPSPIEEQVNKIVEELQKNPEISKFTEELKTLDIANVNTDELTVFAVKNEAFKEMSKASVPQSIKRHIAKGGYAIDQLKDSMILKSITDDSLLVIRKEDQLFINGISIETTGVKVGKSVIYEVEGMIPAIEDMEDQPAPVSYHTTIRVLRCNQEWSPENEKEAFPLSDAKVEVYKYEYNAQGEPTNVGALLGEGITDQEGRFTIDHQEDLLAFKAYKGDSLTNLYHGLVVEGVFTTQQETSMWPQYRLPDIYPDGARVGCLKLQDVNGDGLVDLNDKVESVPLRDINLSEEGDVSEFKIYLASSQYVNWKETLAQTIQECEDLFSEYSGTLREVNNRLTKDTPTAMNQLYSTGLAAISKELWDDSYKALQFYKEANKKFYAYACPPSITEQWEEYNKEVQMQSAIIYSTLIHFYGGAYLVEDEVGASLKYGVTPIADYLKALEETLPRPFRYAVLAAEARIYFNNTQSIDDRYIKVKALCDMIVDSGEFALSAHPGDVFQAAESKASLAGGYPDKSSFKKGEYYHPIRYEEVLFMLAEADIKLGMSAGALEIVNMWYLQQGMAPMLPPGASNEEILAEVKNLWSRALDNEGFDYVNLRRWDSFMEYFQGKGVQSAKSHNNLLPIPPDVIAAYPDIQQNPGY
ncbi:fasciclin domain-containing protein [Parabacteroides pacaensis]|uniref:fasciclin domain-containing protein n=1 Tax=Parabacteroides pacaensis TaxID=2086575 RepID=UPI000D102E5E|nr:RagB/SusD family nutrient uptake outer membrane protein [Parabacteroides pacaensis]